MLADELGLDPGVELQELEAAILAQDPALLPPVPARVAPSAAPPRLGGIAEPLRRPRRGDRRARRARRRPPARHRRRSRRRGQDPAGDRGRARRPAASRSWFVELAPGPRRRRACSVPSRTPSARPTGSSATSAGDDAPTDRLARFIGTGACLARCSTTASTSSTRRRASPRRCSWRVPSLRILATSREPLAIGGETCGRSRRWRSTTRSSSSPTGRRRRAPSCSTTTPKPSSARSAHRLDGLPLAVELAAGRVRAIPVGAARVAARRPLPAPHGRRPHRAPPPADAACRRRVELRPALRRRASRLRAPVRLRRRLLARGRRSRVRGRRRRRRGRRRPARAPRGQVARDRQPGGRRRALRPPADARALRAGAARRRRARWTRDAAAPRRPLRASCAHAVPTRSAAIDQVAWLREVHAEADNLRAALGWAVDTRRRRDARRR